MKTRIVQASVIVALSAFALGVAAQGGPRGPGYGAGYQARQAASGADPAASAAAPTGRGPGARAGSRLGPDQTPGWALMTPQERAAHRQQMDGAKTRDECLAIFGEHMKGMAERAQAQGKTLPGPRRDPCERFKP